MKRSEKDTTSKSIKQKKAIPTPKPLLNDQRPSTAQFQKQINTIRNSTQVQKAAQRQALANQYVAQRKHLKQVSAGSSDDQTIQREEITEKVKGLTHIVAAKGNSIYRGKEGPEVKHGDKVTIETSKKIRSRRGPNQETFGKHDEHGEHWYRWVQVLDTTPKKKITSNSYIRDDALESEGKNIGGRDSMLNKKEQRTRGSHRVIKFEVWRIDPSLGLNDFGHMVMQDKQAPHDEQYKELSQPVSESEKAAQIPHYEELPQSYNIDDGPVSKGSAERKTRKIEKDKGFKPLHKHVLSKEAMRERQGGKVLRKTGAPKYSLLDTASVVVTNAEYDELMKNLKNEVMMAYLLPMEKLKMQ